MKRDVDLSRQLLLDIEAQGADCSLSTIRPGLTHDVEERIRYHIRLLIDAGMLKEVDRTAAGVPCVRLTNAGHELLELCRHEECWREAKWAVRERTGGLSLTALRAVLTKWAVEDATHGEHYRGRREYRHHHWRTPRRRMVERPTAEAPEEELRLLRARSDYRERFEWRERYDARPRYERNHYEREADLYDSEADDATVGVSLPIYLV